VDAAPFNTHLNLTGLVCALTPAAALRDRTLRGVLLLSSRRAEEVAVLIVLPPDARIVAHFYDDDSTRDVTLYCADLLLEYLLRGGSQDAELSPEDSVVVADVKLEGCDTTDARLALIDLQGHTVGELPPAQIPLLLAGAVAMAVGDAVSPSEGLSDS
jgi:hypothetical protein